MEIIETPFTIQQYQALAEEEKIAIDAVAEFLPEGLAKPLETDEQLSETFNLLKPCLGCIPPDEVDEDVFQLIRRKFRVIYQAGIDLAGQALASKGLRPFNDFSLTLIIDARRDDASDVAIVDYHRPACYLYEAPRAWEFHFTTLAEIANAVLRVKHRLTERVLLLARPEQSKKNIYVRVQGGLVQDVVEIPPGIAVVVLDYDVDDIEEPERLQLSPLDGALCCMSHF